MTTKNLIIFVFFISTNAFGKNLIDSLTTKFNYKLSIDIGGHYNINCNQIRERKIGDGSRNPTNSIYGDYRYHSSAGSALQTGLWLNQHFSKRVILKTGLLYFSRESIIEGNVDTIIKYALRNSDRYKKDYVTYHTFEIPLLVGYKLKKINFYSGVKIPVYTIRQDIKIFISETITKSSTKFFVNPLRNANLTFRFTYELAVKKCLIILYLAVDNRILFKGLDYLLKSNYDFQFGVEIPFLKYPTKNKN